MSSSTLSIATLNLWGRKGMFKERMALLCDELDANDFDVLCFQEVLVENGSHHLLNHLEGRYKIYEAPTMGSGSGTWYGNVLATRTPLLEVRLLGLSIAGCDEPRNAVLATVASHPSLGIVATHLSNGSRRRKQRHSQGLEIISGLREQFGVSGWIIAGDLNATANERRLHKVFNENGFWDAHSGAQLRQQHNFHLNHNLNSQARGIVDKLDYIILKGPRPMLLEQGFFAVNPKNGTYISDHIGLYANINLANFCEQVDSKENIYSTHER